MMPQLGNRQFPHIHSLQPDQQQYVQLHQMELDQLGNREMLRHQEELQLPFP